ncbi:MAG: ABC transporter substrate-binding protein [Verrucomicrobiota bacterium]|jgi:iron complex transport system substrate-binding protein|nr:ABC transporter substrate-binding protein [Verrucomicrobiota bacterium]
MTAIRRIVVLLAYVFLLLGTRASHAGTPVPAVDANGDVLSLAAPPRRILAIGKAALMPADALFLFPEAREHVIALARVDQGLGNLYSLIMPRLNQNYDWLHQSGIEEIARHHPDLVLTKSSNTEAIAIPLRRLGIPSFTLSLETPEEWEAEVPELGKLLGEEARAAEIVKHFQARRERVAQALLSPAPERIPSVLVLHFSSYDGATAFSVSPDAWLQTRLVELAGGRPVWKGERFLGTGWSKISFEQVAAWNPDHIYIVSFKASADSFLRFIRADERWQALRAVQNDHVKALPADLIAYAQPVSRWVLCLQWLAADLHPDRFPGFDMEQEITRFYRDFYDLNDPAILDTLLNAYRRSIAGNEM